MKKQSISKAKLALESYGKTITFPSLFQVAMEEEERTSLEMAHSCNLTSVGRCDQQKAFKELARLFIFT